LTPNNHNKYRLVYGFRRAGNRLPNNSTITFIGDAWYKLGFDRKST
jgi:hypothetical protein